MSDLKETTEKSERSETKVVNLFREKYDVYIGRKGKGEDGYFGNPFDMRNFTREKCLAMYKEHFDVRITTDPVFREKILGLRGKRLGCFCKPNACHGDIIAEYVNAHFKKWDQINNTSADKPQREIKFDSELRTMANNVDAANLPDDVKIPEVQMHEGTALGGKQFKAWYNDNKAFIMTRVCQQRTATFETVKTPRITEQQQDHNLYLDKKRRIMESMTG